MLLKFFVFLCFTILIVEASHGKSGNCPVRGTNRNCGFRCLSDYQCNLDEKCCPNICGSTSCVKPTNVSTGNDGGYKGSSGDTGVYCGGQACSKYEKCEFDKKTKREKCVRT